MFKRGLVGDAPLVLKPTPHSRHVESVWARRPAILVNPKHLAGRVRGSFLLLPRRGFDEPPRHVILARGARNTLYSVPLNVTKENRPVVEKWLRVRGAKKGGYIRVRAASLDAQEMLSASRNLLSELADHLSASRDDEALRKQVERHISRVEAHYATVLPPAG